MSNYEHKTIVEADRYSYGINFRELMQYKDLFWTFVYRDIRVRYAQTFLGLAWALIQPLVTLGIFVLVFGKAIKVDTGSIPYPVFALCGMAVWSYFAHVMSQSGQSVIGAQEMVKKIYFPRLVLPLGKALGGLIDFAIVFSFLLIFMLVQGVVPSGNLIFFPVFVVLTVLCAVGVGIWLSALSIRYRDFLHVVPFLVQIGLYATPVAYPASLVPPEYRLIYHLNPMVGIVEGFRWSVLGTGSLSLYTGFSICLVVIIFATGLFYFRRMERILADIV